MPKNGLTVGITGGLGFIGGALVKALLLENGVKKIVVLDNFVRPMHTLQEDPRLQILRGDIRLRYDVFSAFSEADVIVNLAAISSVIPCEQNPKYAWQVNATALRNFAPLVLNQGKKLIQASSREVYGEVNSLPVSENFPIKGKNVYGQSKEEAERLAFLMKKAGGDVSILRFANVIGTHDQGRLIPNWLHAAATRQPLVVFGGDQVIDFVPVDVAVQALIRCILSPYSIGPVNVGSGTATSLKQLAQRVQNLYPDIELQILPARESEVRGFQANVDRMMAELNITPPKDPLSILPQLARFYSGEKTKV